MGAVQPLATRCNSRDTTVQTMSDTKGCLHRTARLEHIRVIRFARSRRYRTSRIGQVRSFRPALPLHALQRGLSLLKVPGLEPFCEPTAHIFQEIPRLRLSPILMQQPSQARCRTQLEPFGSLLSSNVVRVSIAMLHIDYLSPLTFKQLTL